MTPLIGLNVDINVEKPTEARIARRYYEMVEATGATPVLIPPMSNTRLRHLLDYRLDGAIMIGGRDYSTKLYGGDETAPHRPLDPAREEFDIRFGKMLLHKKRKHFPKLFICAGEQLLIGLLGGKLVEHIPDYAKLQQQGLVPLPANWQPVAHQDAEGNATKHAVSLVKGTLLAQAYRKRRLKEIVSSHHQGSVQAGGKLVVNAYADDGMIEGVEWPAHDFCVGVQWHPEFEKNSPIFRALIGHAWHYNYWKF
jgi:putative glutamine amidotransferase